MSGTVGAHNELHSEQGALPGEHPGRSRNPVIKVADLAWLEFEKPDLDRAEAFARAFGFTTAAAHRRRAAVARHRHRRACVLLSPRAAVAIRRHRVQGRTTKSTCYGWPTPPGRPRKPLPESHRRPLGGSRRPERRSRSVWSQACTTCPSCPLSDRTSSTSATNSIAPTRPSARPGCQPMCSDSATSCCRPPNTRGAELLPRQPRDDRQRLPLLPRPA